MNSMHTTQSGFAGTETRSSAQSPPKHRMKSDGVGKCAEMCGNVRKKNFFLTPPLFALPSSHPAAGADADGSVFSADLFSENGGVHPSGAESSAPSVRSANLTAANKPNATPRNDFAIAIPRLNRAACRQDADEDGALCARLCACSQPSSIFTPIGAKSRLCLPQLWSIAALALKPPFGAVPFGPVNNLFWARISAMPSVYTETIGRDSSRNDKK